MKFVVALLIIAFIASGVYIFLSKNSIQSKNSDRKIAQITGAVVIVLLGLLAILMYQSATSSDTQCTTVHKVTTSPPITLRSAMDYFKQGNYDYDIGNCLKAIGDYTISIALNPHYPQTFNNRAYTYMQMRNYEAALADLNRALELNPRYIQALMNRGDIHNYYFQIDRKNAIADYEKVISLGGTHGTSVCGHLFMAKHNGWNLGTILDLPAVMSSMCN
jgi:tetratricopeptide (TPR) repeat protein